MVDGGVFLGAVIIAVTQAIKELAPAVSGHITILVAALLGLVLAVVDTSIGVVDLTVAQGILLGLGAAGVTTVAKKIG